MDVPGTVHSKLYNSDLFFLSLACSFGKRKILPAFGNHLITCSSNSHDTVVKETRLQIRHGTKLYIFRIGQRDINKAQIAFFFQCQHKMGKDQAENLMRDQTLLINTFVF